MDSTLFASPPRRNHFTPKLAKSPRTRAFSSGRFSIPRHTAAAAAAAPTPTSTKRSYATDENNDPSLAILASPSKRVKAVLSSNLGAALKSVSGVQAAPVSRPTKRTFGALVDVTNVSAGSPAHRSDKALPKTRPILKPLSATKKTPSPPRHVRAPSPRVGSGRGVERSHTPPVIRRINPPASLSSPSSSPSIGSILARSFARPRPLNSSPASSDGGVPLHDDTPSSVPPNIPDSWVFDIYEDTPEETLQNLMEHSAHTLYISDGSDSESHTSELQEKGKENIHPDRMAELIALSANDRANAMSIEESRPAIPQRRAPGAGPGGRAQKEHRQALRELRKEELTLPAEKADCAEGGVKLSKCEFQFETPEKPKSPGWTIWESDELKGEENEKANK